MKRAVGFVVVLAALSVVTTACGGGSDDISASARDELAPMVSEVRRLAESYDPYGALLAIGRLRDTVVTLHSHGELGDQRAVEIFSATQDVERRLANAPTTTTTTATLPPLPAPVAGEDNGRGNGEDTGHGKGKGGKGKH